MVQTQKKTKSGTQEVSQPTFPMIRIQIRPATPKKKTFRNHGGPSSPRCSARGLLFASSRRAAFGDWTWSAGGSEPLPDPFSRGTGSTPQLPPDGTWKQSIPPNGKNGFAGRSCFVFLDGGEREPEGNLGVGLGQLLDYRKRATLVLTSSLEDLDKVITSYFRV